MRRTSDVWSEPPGGFPAGTRPQPAWRRARGPIAIGVIVALGLGSFGFLRAMGRSTAVSSRDALAEFRSRASQGSEADDERNETDRPKRRHEAARSKEARDERAPEPTVAVGDTSTSPDDAGPEVRTSAGRDEAAPSEGIGRPAEGVYTWRIDGHEEAPGVNRRLPERSPRIVTHRSGNAWQEHLRFSEQREQWFELSSSEKGVASSSVRNRVVMGPVEVDRTVVFDPPMYVNVFPMKVGLKWSGSWEGKTSGTYRGRVFERTTITIEGERVEVWGSEVTMEMQGEVEGRVVTRSWVAPDYNMVVKQFQDMNVTSGPGEYRSEWTGQVLSLTPQR